MLVWRRMVQAARGGRGREWEGGWEGWAVDMGVWEGEGWRGFGKKSGGQEEGGFAARRLQTLAAQGAAAVGGCAVVVVGLRWGA